MGSCSQSIQLNKLIFGKMEVVFVEGAMVHLASGNVPPLGPTPWSQVGSSPRTQSIQAMVLAVELQTEWNDLRANWHLWRSQFHRAQYMKGCPLPTWGAILGIISEVSGDVDHAPHVNKHPATCSYLCFSVCALLRSQKVTLHCSHFSLWPFFKVFILWADNIDWGQIQISAALDGLGDSPHSDRQGYLFLLRKPKHLWVGKARFLENTYQISSPAFRKWNKLFYLGTSCFLSLKVLLRGHTLVKTSKLGFSAISFIFVIHSN